MVCFAVLLGDDEPAWRALYEWHDHDWWYEEASEIERRMWQLFVAEAIGQIAQEKKFPRNAA